MCFLPLPFAQLLICEFTWGPFRVRQGFLTYELADADLMALAMLLNLQNYRVHTPGYRLNAVKHGDGNVSLFNCPHFFDSDHLVLVPNRLSQIAARVVV